MARLEHREVGQTIEKTGRQVQARRIYTPKCGVKAACIELERSLFGSTEPVRKDRFFHRSTGEQV